MARKPFLLRIDSEVFEAVERLAEVDLRSVNGQIEYLLREALARRGVKVPKDSARSGPAPDSSGEPA